MTDLPYIVEVLLALGTDGSSRVKKSNLELKGRECDLFLTAPEYVNLRDVTYKLMNTNRSDMTYLSDGNPYKMLKYKKY